MQTRSTQLPLFTYRAEILHNTIQHLADKQYNY